MISRPSVWVVDLAARFWTSIPEPAPLAFPRDLRDSLSYLPHIQIHELSNLSVASAARFLARLNVPFPAEVTDRPLNGFFAACCGTGYILVNASDSAAEQRLTVAHELAHFLRDYERPRCQAVARFGETILEVFDGLRPPTPNEQLVGILRGVTIGCHSHLLSRDERGRPESLIIREAEEAADRFAFELLAPFSAVTTEPISNRDSLADRLVSMFGLPPLSAAKYAAILLPGDFSRKISPAFAKI